MAIQSNDVEWIGKETEEDEVMFTLETNRVHRGVSVVVAAAIVGISGLVIERGHHGAASRAPVDMAQVEPADALSRTTMLPEVVVTAPRLAAA
jgi:hypothetical protein